MALIKSLMIFLNPHNKEGLEQLLSARIECTYLPVFSYISSLLDRHSSTKPLIVGISAPQGCGKTTLTEVLTHMFSLENKLCASLSLDDFYLTYQDQQQLASKHSSNPLLQYRGNAGTHDLSLALNILNEMRNKVSLDDDIASNPMVKLPRYDKSLHCGRGDRMEQGMWPSLNVNDIRVVLLEGWMLGFSPIYDHASLPADMQEINHNLRAYHELNMIPDCWIHIIASDIRYVYKWRLEAEMKNSHKGGLSEDQVKDFVDRFMPAYQVYLPQLENFGPDRRYLTEEDKIHYVGLGFFEKETEDDLHSLDEKNEKVPCMQIVVDEDRLPIRCKFL